MVATPDPLMVMIDLNIEKCTAQICQMEQCISAWNAKERDCSAAKKLLDLYWKNLHVLHSCRACICRNTGAARPIDQTRSTSRLIWASPRVC